MNLITRVLFGWVICLLICALFGVTRGDAIQILGVSTIVSLLMSVRVTVHKG